jgi:hypothetical protein
MLGPKKCFLLSERGNYPWGSWQIAKEPRFFGLQVMYGDDKTAQAAPTLNYAIGILQKAHREAARSLLAVHLSSIDTDKMELPRACQGVEDVSSQIHVGGL